MIFFFVQLHFQFSSPKQKNLETKIDKTKSRYLAVKALLFLLVLLQLLLLLLMLFLLQLIVFVLQSNPCQDTAKIKEVKFFTRLALFASKKEKKRIK